MADRIGPIPYIFNAIKEGLNATEALEEYRNLGGAIRTQRFYHAFGEVAAELAVRPNIESQSRESRPTGDMIIDRASNRPGQYLARGGVLVSTRTVNPLTGKVGEITQVNFGSVRYDILPTIGEILTDIEGQFGAEGRSGVSNSTVIGSFMEPVLNMVEPNE